MNWILILLIIFLVGHCTYSMIQGFSNKIGKRTDRLIEDLRFLVFEEGQEAAREVESVCNQLNIKLESEDDSVID